MRKARAPLWVWLTLGLSLVGIALSRPAPRSKPLAGAVFPIEVPRVTLSFGATLPPYRPGNPHRGVDLAPWPASTGRPIGAAVGGIVTRRVDRARHFGNYVVTRVELPHTVWASDLRGVVHTVPARTPFYLLYAHMDAINVNRGQRVEAGQPIGTIGETGFALGPHLHLEMRLGDYAARRVVDPMDMLIASIAGLRDELRVMA